jgi:hypothetical protein
MNVVIRAAPIVAAFVAALCACNGGEPGARPAPGGVSCRGAGASAADQASFFVSTGDGRGACGYAYSGASSGVTLRFPRCFEACAVDQPSPSGRYVVVAGEIRTASGALVRRLPNDLLDPRWSDDERQLCGIRGGPTRPLVIECAGLHRGESLTPAPAAFAGLPLNSESVVAVSRRHRVAVVIGQYQTTITVDVVQLASGRVTERTLARHAPIEQDTTIRAALDGHYLAVQRYTSVIAAPSATHLSPSATNADGVAIVGPQHSPGEPVVAARDVDVYDLRHLATPPTRISGELAGLTGDGRRVAVNTASGRTQVWDWRSHRFIADMPGRTTATVSAPGEAAIALEIFHQATNSERILIVTRSGQRLPVPGQFLLRV